MNTIALNFGMFDFFVQVKPFVAPARLKSTEVQPGASQAIL